MRGSVVGIQDRSPACLGWLILEMWLSVCISKFMCLKKKKKNKRLCFPNMQNKFSRMLKGRDLEVAVCHVALIELVLQSCCLGIGKSSLCGGFSQPCVCPWSSPAPCHWSRLLPSSVSAADTRTGLAGQTEAVETFLAAEVGSCHPMHSSSCCTVWVCCHLKYSEGSFNTVPRPAAIWAVPSPIYWLLTEQWKEM